MMPVFDPVAFLSSGGEYGDEWRETHKSASLSLLRITAAGAGADDGIDSERANAEEKGAEGQAGDSPGKRPAVMAAADASS